ncbi:MAG: hypothetical protein SGJ20_13415 [Planctomycetota bacterium]|nr:hypothetical protein [Planctomycetota bacterium]
MNRRLKFAMLLMAAAVTAPGCRFSLPHNSITGYDSHLSQHRPLIQKKQNVLPPAPMLAEPGPGVGGPGPGVLAPAPGAVMVFGLTSQVGFIGADGMKVAWDVTGPGLFDSEALIVPGRYNFGQGAIYRLKLTDIPNRPGVELYPTMEIAPAMPRTEAYLAHNFIPFQLTDEDFDQVLSGNFVTKVLYLPDAEHQELALAGVETLVSTRLDPGVDPIVEADRKGSIMAIIRLGNKDLQTAGGAGPGGAYMPVGGLGAPGVGGTPGLPGSGPGGNCDPSAGGPGAPGMPGYVAGVTTPMYGMPITGTPIGLPGPAHIPLGVPAGLQAHVMRNRTHHHIPAPTAKLTIDVKQKPGLSYPKSPHHVRIVESQDLTPMVFRQPDEAACQTVPGASGGASCTDGNCEPSYDAP